VECRCASRTVAQALHTFVATALPTEYDIHLYNLRAKAWPLVFGDPSRLIEEADAGCYAGETTVLPEVGEISIDFDLGDEARALAQELDAFFKRNLTPELKAKAHYSFDGHDAGLHRKLAQAGLLFPRRPREFGGRQRLLMLSTQPAMSGKPTGGPVTSWVYPTWSARSCAALAPMS